MKALSLALVLLSSLGVASTPAWAMFETKVKFRYNPQELTTETGREALLKRMKTKARIACDQSTSSYSIAKECKADIEKQFVTAIGNSDLIAQYQDDAVKIARNGS